ncbi:MAG: fibronectin type III domain-containing protein [Herbaspirillum sp.]|uniref:fibronectin type III domain-containing protein n=1 Tax=Herbaspirillum sp. TaxID=1890675 RepID=UPI002588AE2D|nr:fibronectin type III domain-containing protein [Herbaspirillum sp.]MCP3654316.1 fibronectin type III domain-containing protein [Herbaspirillum sp.]
MQKLQLYIQGQRVELFDDETVSITQSIQNVKDISKVFTDFSKPFTLPATKSNNKIFKHYYNYHIENTFDARKKVDAEIELNNLPFRKGKVKLEGVGLKDNKPNTYKIVFYGNTVTLKDLLGEDKLQALTDLNDETLVYNDTNVKAKLIVDPTTTDVIAPLITHTQRLFYDSDTGHSHDDQYSGNLYYHSGTGHTHGVNYTELKYALRVHRIIEAIQVNYPEITFSDDFFNTTNIPYYNLFLWLHRKKGNVENLDGVNQSIVDSFPATSFDGDTQSQMINTSTLRISGVINDYIDVDLTLTPSGTTPYKAIVFKDGVEVYQSATVTSTLTINKSQIDLSQADYTVFIQAAADVSFTNISWYVEYRVSYFLPPENTSYSTGAFTHVSAFDFTITQQIPEMKIIDFLTGLFKMFNLTAYVEDNVVIVKTLNAYYSSGTSYDITKYIDVNKSEVNTALPYREISFYAEDTETLLAKQHEQLAGNTWGKIEYKGSDKELAGELYKVVTPFSQLKYEHLIDTNTGNSIDVQWGYFVDDNQDSYYGKPLLFYPIRQTSATEISFVNASGHEPLTTYIIPSNSVYLNPATGKDNINFNVEVNEYTATQDFTDTLFRKYYQNYILSVFDPKNRLTKVTAYLPLNILLKFNLSDRFIINGDSYKINSINTNLQTGKSDLELLNDIVISTLEEDTTPPNNVQGLAVDSVTYNSVSISWTGNTDTDLAGYKVYLDGVLNATLGIQDSYTITSLAQNTSYDIRVTAYDTSGNESAFASATEVTAQTEVQDVNAPTKPTNLSDDLIGTTAISISWTASTDDVGIDYYRVYVDDIVQSPTTSNTTYTITGLIPDTQYTINVDAIDTSGNISPLSDDLIVTTTI